jgi:hypothetical protein
LRPVGSAGYVSIAIRRWWCWRVSFRRTAGTARRWLAKARSTGSDGQYPTCSAAAIGGRSRRSAHISPVHQDGPVILQSEVKRTRRGQCRSGAIDPKQAFQPASAATPTASTRRTWASTTRSAVFGHLSTHTFTPPSRHRRGAAAPSGPAGTEPRRPACRPAPRPSACPCSICPAGQRAKGCRTPSPWSVH